MKRILSFVVVFLLIATAVSAAMIVNKHTNDFSVSSPYSADIKACSCENRVEPITVTNSGGFPSSYIVSVEAENIGWFSYSLREFNLAPGESREILVYVEPACGVIGTYPYNIRITSNFGRERVLTRNLDVRQCQNAFLTVTGPGSSNLCQPLEFEATLKNVAEFAENYHLDLGSFNTYVNYTEGGADNYLLPNEERTLEMTITPPCSLYGDILLPFTVTSEKNDITEQRLHPVFIENQFDHEIVTPTQYEVCSRLGSTFTFGVKNLIDVPNMYDVIITGPGFMNYETKSLELQGNEEKNITVTLDPNKGNEGTYTLKIRVISKLGDIKKSRDVELQVFDCYAYLVGFVEQPTDSSGAYTDAACCGEKTYTLNVKNSGQTEETYSIVSDGPNWFQPEESTIRLKPSENRNVRFNARLPCTDETYEIPVTIGLTKYPSISETLVFKVNSQTLQTCHAVEMRTGQISMDEEATVVPFIIRHTGLEGGTYKLALDGELFSSVLEHEISLEPGEEKVVHFKTKANLSEYFDGKYLGALTIVYDDIDLEYKAPFWTRFSHVSGLTKAWRTIGGYNYATLPLCFWVALVLVLLIIAAAIWLIVALTKRRPSGRKSTLVVLRGLLIVALIVAILWLSLASLPSRSEIYEEPVDDQTGLLLQWYENERLSVDLSQYFSDPDSDWLEYSATQPAHVSVIIKDGIATMTPEFNWAGSDEIVFSSSDQKGGVSDSPIMTLKVLRHKELSPMQWLRRYCHQIVLVLLIMLLLLLLVISFIAKPQHERIAPPKSGEKGKAIYTVARNGSVQTLGVTPMIPATKLQPKRAKRVKAQSRALAKPGQVFTYTDSKGKKQALGVAETIVWPEPAQQKTSVSGNTVNIAVGTPTHISEPKEFILVGAKNGNKVHDPQCIVAHRIPRKNRVSFTSKSEAIKAGYGPCKVCQSFDKA